MKYRFNEIKMVEDILKTIGREDIPSNQVVIQSPAIDEATGEYLADFEIEFPDEYVLTSTDEDKLETLMLRKGFKRA